MRLHSTIQLKILILQVETNHTHDSKELKCNVQMCPAFDFGGKRWECTFGRLVGSACSLICPDEKVGIKITITCFMGERPVWIEVRSQSYQSVERIESYECAGITLVNNLF